MKPYIIQVIRGTMYIAANTDTPRELRELPPEELVEIMLNANTEVYGGNNRLKTLAIMTDHNITA